MTPRINALDYTRLFSQLQNTALTPWLDVLPATIERYFNGGRWGDLPRWLDCLAQLPILEKNKNILIQMPYRFLQKIFWIVRHKSN